MGQVMSVFGPIGAALGSYSQAKQEKNALAAAERVAHQNTAILKGNAKYVRAEAKDAEAQQRADASRDAGRLTTLLAASGTEISEGSALGQQTQFQADLENDILNLRKQAEQDAYGFEVQAWNSSVQASQLRAKKDAIKPLQRAGASAISQASNALQVAGGMM